MNPYKIHWKEQEELTFQRKSGVSSEDRSPQGGPLPGSEDQ